ncbi:MAG: hypothetical protein JST68_17100 [Bacteroidetes bacterium]|nr:hypothetical protein [Bacteroidota bacterium]
MRLKYVLPALALTIFYSCKRDMIATSGDIDKTTKFTAAALTDQTPLIGIVSVPQVAIGMVTTLVGGPASPNIFPSPAGIAFDVSEKLYVTDQQTNQVKKIDPNTGAVLAVWGSGQAGLKDGSPGQAQFKSPQGICVTRDGRIFIADAGNNVIRSINARGDSVGTVAGSGIAGFADGVGTVPKFNHPTGIAIDAAGTLYVADQLNNMIRRITNGNTVTRWAGQLTPGSKDDAGSLASFNNPTGVAIAGDGSLYVADGLNHKIRRIVRGIVTTVAGSGIFNHKDANGREAGFQFPAALCSTSSGGLFVADFFSSARYIDEHGKVTTPAGFAIGFADGLGAAAAFNHPAGITATSHDRVFIADQDNHAIRQVRIQLAVATLAGNGHTGYQEGTGIDAFIESPRALTAGPGGTVYFYDGRGNLRKCTRDGVTSLVLPAPPVVPGLGLATRKIVVDNAEGVYVPDLFNTSIVGIRNGVTSTLAGNDKSDADRDGQGAGATFTPLEAMTTDGFQNMYVATAAGHIRKVGFDGRVTTIFTNSALANATVRLAYSHNANGLYALINHQTVLFFSLTDHTTTTLYTAGGPQTPSLNDICIDANDNSGPYVAGADNKVYHFSGPTLSPIAGQGIAGDVDGPTATARFNTLSSIASFARVIYVADMNNNRIKIMDAF